MAKGSEPLRHGELFKRIESALSDLEVEVRLTEDAHYIASHRRIPFGDDKYVAVAVDRIHDYLRCMLWLVDTSDDSATCIDNWTEKKRKQCQN